MNKPRRFGTIADAVARITTTVGYDACCAALSVSKSTLYRWSDEDHRDQPCAGHVATLDALAERAGIGRPISQAIAGRIELLTGSRPAHVPADPFERVTTLFREVAESAAAFRAAHGAGSPLAIDEALREAAEAREAIDAVIRDLEAMQTRTAGGLRAVRS